MKNKILITTFFAFLNIFSLYAQNCSSPISCDAYNDCSSNKLNISITATSNQCNSTYDLNKINANNYTAEATIYFRNPTKKFTISNKSSSLGSLVIQSLSSTEVRISGSIDYNNINSNYYTPYDSIDHISFNVILPLINNGVHSGTGSPIYKEKLTSIFSIINGPNSLKINEIGLFSSNRILYSKNYNYKWSSTPNATFDRKDSNNTKVSWSSAGDVSIKLYIRKYLCESIREQTVTIKSLTGLEENSTSNITFNNPVVNKELTFSDVVESVLITTLDGKQILNANNTNFVKVNLPQGLYILAVNGKPTKLIVE